VNGKKAKELRRKVYGEKDIHNRKYFATSGLVETKIPFLSRLATLFTKKYYREQVLIGGVRADESRRSYQRLKRESL